MRHVDWMCSEEKPPSKSMQLARELASSPVFCSPDGNLEIVVPRRSLLKREVDLIEAALRAYDKDR